MASSPTSTLAAPVKLRKAARTSSTPSRRGFAAMDPAKRQALARSGGQASVASGKAHRFTSEEARAAGRMGGQISRRGPVKATS